MQHAQGLDPRGRRSATAPAILTLTFFNQAWRAKRAAAGRRGIFAGKVGDYRGAQQLAHPDYELFDDEDPTRRGRCRREALGASRRSRSTRPRARSRAGSSRRSIALRARRARPDVDDPLPDERAPARTACSTQRARARAHPPPRGRGRLAGGAAHAAHARGVRAAGRAAAAAGRARARTRRPRGVRRPAALLERFDASLPFPLTRRPARRSATEIARRPRAAAADEPARAGRGRLGQDARRAARDARGRRLAAASRRCSRPPRCSPASTCARSPAMLGPDLSRRARADAAHRPAARRRAPQGRCCAPRPARRASWSARTRCSATPSTFADLGLVVVDEQHRFGVEQREALRAEGQQPPHVLVLTATPIPRTVAMTVFGDLDVSTIRRCPAGRAGIETLRRAARRAARLVRRASGSASPRRSR